MIIALSFLLNGGTQTQLQWVFMRFFFTPNFTVVVRIVAWQLSTYYLESLKFSWEIVFMRLHWIMFLENVTENGFALKVQLLLLPFQMISTLMSSWFYDVKASSGWLPLLFVVVVMPTFWSWNLTCMLYKQHLAPLMLFAQVITIIIMCIDSWFCTPKNNC